MGRMIFHYWLLIEKGINRFTIYVEVDKERQNRFLGFGPINNFGFHNCNLFSASR